MYMCLDGVTHHSADLYPWRKLEDLREKLGIEFEVIQAAFSCQELEGEVIRLQILREPGVVLSVCVCVCVCACHSSSDINFWLDIISSYQLTSLAFQRSSF